MHDALEIQQHLRKFVSANYPDQSKNIQNRRFHPQVPEIRNHMYLSQMRQLHSKNDQENLLHKVRCWQERFPDDKFKCQLRLEDEISGAETQRFLFAYQSKLQRRLLAKYGKITLLDATYKTMRYSLPLFFVCVRTNVNYQVVGAFIIQNETKDEIKAGLEVIKEWNGDWQPEYFMTDFDEKEIQGLEEIFSEADVYLCDFHREQAWTRWVSATNNGVRAYRTEVLARLRRVARADSVADYRKSLNALMESSVWKESTKLQQWFSNQWLPEYKVSHCVVQSDLIGLLGTQKFFSTHQQPVIK